MVPSSTLLPCIEDTRPIPLLVNMSHTMFSFIRLDNLGHHPLVELDVHRILIIRHDLPLRAICPEYLVVRCQADHRRFAQFFANLALVH